MAPFWANYGSKFCFLGGFWGTFKKNPTPIGRKCVGHTRARGKKQNQTKNQRKNEKNKKAKKKNKEQYPHSFPSSYPYP